MEEHDDLEPSSSTKKTILCVSTAATLLDLKADLLKRTKNLKKTEYSENYVNRTKNNLLIVTKEEKRVQNEQKSARQERITKNEALLKKEQDEELKRKEVLERKAAAYERLSKGETMVREDGTAAEFLVNFHEKVREIDSAADKRIHCELERERKEASPEIVEFNPSPLIVHYDHNEDKGRVFGPSHVKLPHLNEEEREKKIRELLEMTEKTKDARKKRQKQRSDEEQAKRNRLNLLRQRKGLPPIESSDEEGEPEIIPPIPKDVQDIPLPEGQPSSSTSDKEPPKKKAKPQVREWDRGKTGFGYEYWVKKEREKRENDFAPPKFY